MVLWALAAVAATACAKAPSKGSGFAGFPTSASPAAPSRASGSAREGAFGSAEEEAPSFDDELSVADAPRDTTSERRASPGLGTAFGERMDSRVVRAPFQRRSSDPEIVLTMHYDDLEGVQAAARLDGVRSPPEPRGGSSTAMVGVALIDQNGEMLPAFDVGGRRYAVGEPGQRYTIGIENGSGERWEVVASVDGLDVIDGAPAGFDRRGYVVDAFSSIEIAGWRTSPDGVSAFRFSALPESFAGRTGRTRNVGVIGVAFFGERGMSRAQDLERRRGADAFPVRFASPPPPRR